MNRLSVIHKHLHPLTKHLTMEVLLVPCLRDNYGFLLHCPKTKCTAAVDTPEAKPLLKALQEKGWSLTHILNTHHHADHTGGNLELKKAFPECKIVGAACDVKRLPGVSEEVEEGSRVLVGEQEARVLYTPGHTTGHISYYFPNSSAVFVGDTLFSMGCGRLFEGTPAMMWESLSKLAALPDDTKVYCAHEYTEANGRFAATIDPSNTKLAQRIRQVAELRQKGEPTVPTTIGLEKDTNPFLRPTDAAVQRTVGLEGKDVVQVFAEIRKRKDNF